MIFRQLFEPVSGTYSYVLASRRGGEALIIDPVLEKVEQPAPGQSEDDGCGGPHQHASGSGAGADRTAWLGLHGRTGGGACGCRPP